MENLLNYIHKELLASVDLTYQTGVKRYFKEKINPIGVRTPIVRKIANKYYSDTKDLNKKEIFDLCEKLLEKRTYEETLIAFSWARKIRKGFEAKDFVRFEKWVKKYVDNWAFCDDFCTHALGELAVDFPVLLPKIKTWTKSKNRWERRASAVTLIPISKQSKYLKNIFATADILLQDNDNLVQKGYGWLLKVTADSFPKEVFQFVMKRKDIMPRTALRYAIEKYPKEMKIKAMR